ncbi:protein translocase subunit SecDF [Mesonia aestuariivivens]|uniref:Multifunctional fusion protein n=1 Tax=Mesonia aestuariivivens TaxID=2796128 RepID=A0ABS6W2S0_9FLAO|nr:protein translocase subunit SecDF [Mesonia aestuariivivens]MBW2962153.1 protein translocase subunit SecDF [Mesonia aestuariivivens]
MQNKGIIKLFAILFGLVSIYQLSFTFIANKVEDEAKTYANQKISEDKDDYATLRDLAERRYLDSIGGEEVFAGITYNTAKNKELNKGLDLKGGINVILQISVKDILKELANGSDNPAFTTALTRADELQRNGSGDYLDLFFQAFAENEDAKLASPDIFANKALSEEINFDTPNAQVEKVIKRKVNESITSAFEVLRKRIDKFGVTQPNIQRLGDSGRILVELPGAKDVDRVKGLLQSTAQLEFWDVYKGQELFPFLGKANEKLKSIVGNDKVETSTDSTQVADEDNIDDLLENAEEEEATEEGENPIFDLIQAPGQQGGPVIASFQLKDTATVGEYLRMPEVKALLPLEQRYAKFVWGKPLRDSELVDLYALKGNKSSEPDLSGSVITDATQTYDQLGRIVVSMNMNGKGAKKWEEMTNNAYQQGSQIAIVLDNVVYSAPGLSNGPIAGGRSQISGDFTVAEGKDLANVLRAGKLPASADIVQSEIVGPSLGQEAIDSGINSFLIALLFVLAWMIFYYGKAGLFADVALAVNILFIFGILAGLGAVLTLPGIAGIVLTIGMSVDANVLIFERIKEELDKGKSQVEAIKDGFKNALSSILDANITTGLTGVILLVFGTGPIKGFATTLLIGIATSLFTAIFITRLFIDGYGKNGKSLAFSTGATKNLFKTVNIKFIAKRKIAYVISGIAIVASLISLATVGLNQGVDFVGGRTYTVRFDQPVSPTEIEQDLVAEFGSAEAKTFGSDNQLKITTKYKVEEEGTEVDNEISEKLYGVLQSYLPNGTSYKDFSVANEDSEVGIMSSMKVGPTIADDIKEASYFAVIGSLIVVFLYILFRFRKWQFSLGAVVAVFHDVLIILGIFSLTYSFMPFNMEINQAFIAAILTVVGYSLNDTVVVFDRIREYFDEYENWPFNKTINSALNSTISRTVNTSLTTLIVLLAIFIFGGESIRGFMFALIIGVVVGTYSSLFIATPIMYDTAKKKSEDLLKRKEEENEQEELA